MKTTLPRRLLIPKPHGGTNLAYYACPDCGNVFTLPSSGEPDDRPYCFHAGNYTWRKPHHSSNSTQMVYAAVYIEGPE